MVIELVSVSAPSGRMQEFGRALASLVGPIEVQPGCLSCRLLRAWPTHDRLQMQARWDSEEDLIKHLQSDDYRKLLVLLELSDVPPVVEYFTVLKTKGLDLVEAARASPN